MKKIVCLGLTAMMAASAVGCSNKTENIESAQPQANEAVVQENIPDDSEIAKVLLLEDEDFEPFFKALYSFSEEQFNLLNQNQSTAYVGYFENLKIYRDDMKKVLGKFLSDETTKLLEKQNIKLDFDLPKKAQINDYVVEAKGTVEKVEVKSSRKMGDEYIYEVTVTTTNHVQPYNKFYEAYGWNEDIGYYQPRELGSDLSFYEVSKHNEELSYTFPDNENLTDAIKIKSDYFVYVLPEADFEHFKVNKVKQAGSYEVDQTVKQKLDNTDYIVRVPYYEEASAEEVMLIKKFMGQLMTQPRENYQYYSKIFNESYDLINSFWKDMGLQNEVSLDEATYKQAFNESIIPLKGKDEEINYDESKLQIATSIYGTQVQPAFIVTVPVAVLEKDTTQKYYQYKYYIQTENNKVEAVKYIRRNEMTKEEYEAPLANEGEAEQTDITEEVANGQA